MSLFRPPAEVLNRMQPRLLSALRVIPIPGTELYNEEQAGEFVQLTEAQAMHELRTLIAGRELQRTLFRAMTMRPQTKETQCSFSFSLSA